MLFCRTDVNTVEEFRKKYKILFPVLSAQKNLNILRKNFKLGDYSRHILLIDPELKVKFSSNFVKEDDIRQILEKHLIGKITYINELQKKELKVGKLFPHIEVIDLNSKAKKIISKDFSQARYLWIIFTSSCISCILDNSLSMFSLMENDLRRKFLNIGLIFSPYFNEEEIIHKVKKLNIQTPVFLAKSELYTIEDLYYKTPYENNDIICIIKDSNNLIENVWTFPELIKQAKGGFLR